MTGVRSSTSAYLGLLGLVTVVLLWVAVSASEAPGGRDLLLGALFAGCTALSVALPVHVGAQQKLALYVSVMFAGILLLNPWLATVSIALGTLGGQLARQVPAVEWLFNVLQTALQTVAGGLVLLATGWDFETLRIADLPAVLTLLLAVLVIEAINIVLVAGTIALESSESLVSALRAVAPQEPIAMAAPYALGVLAAVTVDAHLWTLPLLALLAVEVRRSSERHARLRRQAAEMEHQALHDALTGLPNRRLFIDRVEQALARATRHGQQLAVLFLDLDRFKIVNDTLGHRAGDELLAAVALRISSRVRQQDTVARLGGDEFTLLVEGIGSAADAERVARRVTDSLHDPFAVDDHPVTVSASVGIALNVPGESTADDLIKRADIALHHAKARGGNAIIFYRSSDPAFTLDRVTLETDLRQAVELGQLRLHFQPQIDLVTARVTAVEALLRWEHPSRGLLQPAEFLPFAEESGFIIDLGQWVLHTACQQARVWHEQWNHRAPIVSVNLSVRQIHERDLLEDVVKALESASLPPRLLALEVTEGMMFERTGDTLLAMQRLKALGVRLVIDDFGTGYAGLSYLKRIPADELKIDQSFIRGLAENSGDRAIVEAIETLAHNLAMRVVAEGVETARQLALLQAIGCDAGQGFFFSRPVPADELTQLVVNGRLTTFASS